MVRSPREPPPAPPPLPSLCVHAGGLPDDDDVYSPKGPHAPPMLRGGAPGTLRPSLPSPYPADDLGYCVGAPAAAGSPGATVTLTYLVTPNNGRLHSGAGASAGER